MDVQLYFMAPGQDWAHNVCYDLLTMHRCGQCVDEECAFQAMCLQPLHLPADAIVTRRRAPSDRGVVVRTCARPTLVEQGRQFGFTTDEDLRRHEGVIASTASHFVTNPPFDKRSQTGYR